MNVENFDAASQYAGKMKNVRLKFLNETYYVSSGANRVEAAYYDGFYPILFQFLTIGSFDKLKEPKNAMMCTYMVRYNDFLVVINSALNLILIHYFSGYWQEART